MKLPIGGKKKKFNAAVAATAIAIAYRSPQFAEASRSATRYSRATVVGLAWSRKHTTVTAAMVASATPNRAVCLPAATVTLALYDGRDNFRRTNDNTFDDQDA